MFLSRGLDGWVARALTLAVATALVAGAGVTTSAAGASTTPAAPRVITGKIIDSKSASHSPTPEACVYPFYVYDDASNPSVVNSYLPTQVMAEPASACSDMSGHYSVNVPPIVTDGMSLKALVVTGSRYLVSKIIDFPSSGTTMDIALDPQKANVQAVTTKDAQPWETGIALVTDHATGAFLGAAKTNDFIDLKDNNRHFYVGLSLSADTSVDVHYLTSGVAISSDVRPSFNVTASATVNTDIGPVELGPLAEVTGHVTLDGTKPAPYQTVAAECTPPAAAPCGTLGVTNANGAFTFWVQADKTYIYSYGGGKVRAKFAGGTGALLPSARLAPAGAHAATYQADPPTYFGKRAAVTLTGLATFNWSGGAPESAPLSWARTQASSAWKSGLGKYATAVVDLTQTRTVKLVNGTGVCVRVNTTTFVAPLNASEAGSFVSQCQTAPLDDRSLVGSKWRRGTSATAFGKTVSVSTAARATLTLTGVTGHQLAVVWARSTHAGSFTVSVNGAVIKTVNTKGASASKQVTYLPVKTMKAAKVVVTATSSAPVSIDGLAVLP